MRGMATAAVVFVLERFRCSESGRRNKTGMEPTTTVQVPEEVPHPEKLRSGADSARETKIYVLADSGGAVGAFLTHTDAAAVMKRYPSVPMLVYAFQMRPGAPVDKAYIVPYRPMNAVAYASNSRAECEKVQKTLLTLGLTYEDPLDYWECTLGRLIASGEKRLSDLQELERLALDSSACAEMRKDSDEKTKQLFELHDRAVEAALVSFGYGPAVGAPPEGAAEAPEAVSILEFVVPGPVE
jgi:hypothetical protein